MTAAICEAVGDTRGASGLVLGTTNGGTNWTQQPVPKDTEGLEAISCPSHLACIAVGRNVITDTTNGGLTWATRVVSHVSFTGISCGGPKTCVAVGSPATNNSFCPDGVSYTTTDLGKSWSSTKLGCFQPAGISCPLASTCIAIGQQTANGAQFGQIMGTTDAGSNWQVQYKLVGGVTTLGGVACASATMCEVVGGSQKTPVLGTTNGGRSWIAQPTPALEVELTGVDCPSAQSCQAVGGGQSLTTANGGQTWGTQATPSAVAVFNSVACPLTTSCFGVGVSQVQAGLTLNLTS
jgi:photosystem II stability/assembly factor-like uncharacterized protein